MPRKKSDNSNSSEPKKTKKKTTKTNNVESNNTKANNVESNNTKANNVKANNTKTNNVKKDNSEKTNNVESNNTKANNVKKNNSKKTNNVKVNNTKANNVKKDNSKKGNIMQHLQRNKPVRVEREPTNITNTIENMSIYFDNSKNKKLKLSNISKYNLPRADDIKTIIKHILAHVSSPETKTITDAVALAGNMSIAFAKHFKHVNAVESNKLHQDMLKNNIEAYGLKNISVIEKEFEPLLTNQDVIYISPTYVPNNKYPSVRLFLNGQPLSLVINKLKKSACIIALRVPRNFDYTNFFQRLEIRELTVYNEPHFNVIIFDFSK